MSGLVLNIERRTATAHGITVKLPRYQIIILLELYRGAPFFVTKQHLMSCFWEHGKYMPADPEKTMNVHVCKLRSILRLLGIGIMTERGQGYRLVDQGPVVVIHDPLTIAGSKGAISKSSGGCIA